MFANLLQIITGGPPRNPATVFVEEARVLDDARPRNQRVERMILICWLLIAIKCALVVWAIGRYHMQLDPLWVNGPTVFFGLMCTAAFYWSE